MMGQPSQNPQPPPYAPGMDVNHPLGLQQQMPAMYPPIPGMYPGMIPPGQGPWMYPFMMPQGPRKSSLPLQGLIVGIFGVVAGILLLIIPLGIILDFDVVYYMAGICCIFVLFLEMASLGLSIWGTIVSSIAVANISKGRYVKDDRARIALICSITSCALFVISNTLFVIGIMTAPYYF